MKKGQVVGGLIALLILVGAAAAIISANNKDDQHAEQTTHSSSEQTTPSSTNNENTGDTSSQSQASATTSIDISNYAYTPSTIKVKVGQTVTWTNQDSVSHDVMADSPSSDAPSSEMLEKGESYSFTFNKAGTYSYHCTPHTYMKGTVIVE